MLIKTNENCIRNCSFLYTNLDKIAYEIAITSSHISEWEKETYVVKHELSLQSKKSKTKNKMKLRLDCTNKPVRCCPFRKLICYLAQLFYYCPVPLTLISVFKNYVLTNVLFEINIYPLISMDSE